MAYSKASGLSLDELEQALREAEARIDAAGGSAPASGAGSCHEPPARQQEEQQQQRQQEQGQEQEQGQGQGQGQEQGQEGHLTGDKQQQEAAQERKRPGEADPITQQQQQQQQADDRRQQHADCHQPISSSSAGGGQQQQENRAPPPPRRRPRRWVPTTGDSLSPGAAPLPSEGLGIGGTDLFSAAHVAGHVRAATELLERLEQSRRWKQVAAGALSMWHCHDRENKVQQFKLHCVVEEPMLVGGGGGLPWRL
jgi:hypothetical protein